MEDPAFHPWIGGSQPERDRAYHQGTVWGFPLGAYFRAVLNYFPKEGKQEVRRGLDRLASWMQEGCLFHLAEIYDGAAPVMSKGCYAQAWSVGEILRVYKEIEGKKMNAVVKRTPAEWKSFFESEEFVENFTYEGDDLGVSVKKSRECEMCIRDRLAIVWVIPVLWIALLSFSTQKGSYVTSFFPKGYTLHNYVRLFTDTQVLDFPQMFKNTFKMCIRDRTKTASKHTSAW